MGVYIRRGPIQWVILRRDRDGRPSTGSGCAGTLEVGTPLTPALSHQGRGGTNPTWMNMDEQGGCVDSRERGNDESNGAGKRGQSNQNAIALAGSGAALTTPGTGRTIYARRCTAYGGMTTPAPDAPWCSGSTSAFGAVSPGSNPGGAATFTTTDQLTWRRRSRLMPPAGILIGCDERTEALLLAQFVGDGFRRLQNSSRRIPLADSLPTPENRREY